MRCESSELFSVNGHDIDLSMLDFWRWAYSDFSDIINRSALAEFIVSSSLGTSSASFKRGRNCNTNLSLITYDGYRVDIKSAAFIQSINAEYPDRISFRIAPIKDLNTNDNYNRHEPRKRHSDVHIFCLYKGLSADESPLNLDLWDFYLLPTKVLEEKLPTQKTISFTSLMRLGPLWCDYYGIGEAIKNVMNA